MVRLHALSDPGSAAYILCVQSPSLSQPHQVCGTPDTACLLHILQSLLLIERGTARANAIWATLEKIMEGAVTMLTPQHSDRVYFAGMSNYYFCEIHFCALSFGSLLK